MRTATDADRRARFEAVATEVFDPLQRYLRRRATSEDAADVFSTTLLTIWRRLDDVPTDEPLPWCYGVARRTLANHRRGVERHLRLVERVGGTASIVAVDAAAAIDDQQPELVAALATLSDADAEIVRLWAWEGLEPREIATVLDTTPNAVSVALSRSKRRLRAELVGQDPPPPGQEPDGTTRSGEREGSGR